MAAAEKKSATKWIAAAVVAAVLVTGIVAYSYYTAGTAAPPRQYKMALVLGGDETDAGWSYMAVVGAEKLRDKYGWQIDISRLVSFADGPRVARDYAQRGYDLVWAQGGQFIDAIYKVAPEF